MYQRFGKDDARKQGAAITFPSGRLCVFLPGLSIDIIRVSGKRPYSDICPQGDSCPRIFFAAIKTSAPRIYQLGKNPPHRFKSTLQSVKLGNIHGHGWKDRLKISKLAEFGTDLLKKIEFRKVAKF